jgi:hypothetical protein
MMRIRMLALPVLAALAFPLIADAGIGLRGRFSARSGEVVSEAPATAAASSTTKSSSGGPATAAPVAPAVPAGTTPIAPAGPGCPPAAVAPGAVVGGDCGGRGHGHGFFGGLFSGLCSGGCFDGHGGHGGLANHPPEYGQGFRGFGFCQPPFQAAPWYLYWPYDAHFQLPAPITAQFYPPQQFGNQMNPYFPGPAMGPGPGMGPGPMMGPGGPGPHFGPGPR